ncbi:MAG: hypothetical protein Q8R83_07665 [Legionellaceae bacterium]|nr:hypothetical protein [Legionellaceae bacterium]
MSYGKFDKLKSVVSREDEATRKARASIRGVFDAIKQDNTTSFDASKTKSPGFPTNIEIKDLKSKRENDWLSSDVDWLSPPARRKYSLVKSPPVNTTTTTGPFLHVSVDSNEVEATYTIQAAMDQRVNGTIRLSSCALINVNIASKIPEKKSKRVRCIAFDDLKTLVHTTNKTVVRTNDDILYLADPNLKTLTLIPHKAEHHSKYLELKKACGALNDDQLTQTTVEQRDWITTLVPGHPTFAIDEIPKGLVAGLQNRYDEGLDPIFDATPKPVIEKRSENKEFFDMLNSQEGHVGIERVMSNSEILKYYLAYAEAGLLSNTKSNLSKSIQGKRAAFNQEMKYHIIQETRKDIQSLLDNESSEYPKETIELAKKIMKKLQSKDREVEYTILQLRRLREFLDTTWAKGTAITEYAATEDNTSSLSDYAPKKVIKADALPIDAETMPDYERFKTLFQEFSKEVNQYTFEMEVKQARNELQTKLYLITDEDKFNEIKAQGRNCFFQYNSQLYHINSDGMMRCFSKVVVNDCELISYVNKKDRDSFYGPEYTYSEKQMRDFLGDDFPEDPKLHRASAMLQRAVKGTSYWEYLQAVNAQMPRFGKYVSFVHKGKLQMSKSGLLMPKLNPTTVFAKSQTKEGWFDSMQKYRIAREVQRATYHDLSSEITPERIDAVRKAGQMARGELIVNQRMNKKECGFELWSDPPKNDNAALQGKGKNLYILVAKDKNDPYKALYFVDRSGDYPIVTKRYAKALAIDWRGYEDNADTSQQLCNGLYSMLEVVEDPSIIKRGEAWQEIGFNHRVPGGMVDFYGVEILKDKKNKERIEEIVKDGNVLIFVDSTDKDNPIYTICYQKDNAYEEAVIDDIATIKSNQAFSNFLFTKSKSSDAIEGLNTYLESKKSTTRIPIRSKSIVTINQELDDAISSATKDVGLMATVYDEQLDKYVCDEVSLRLTRLLIQRRERLENKTPAEILENHYRTEIVDSYQYEAFQRWAIKKNGPPPFNIKSGVLYLGLDQTVGKYVCFGINIEGDLSFTPAIIEPNDIQGTNKDRLTQLLPIITEYKLTLELNTSVSPDFITRCEEAQKFLGQIADQPAWWQRRGALLSELLPIEKREKMLEMMAAIAIDPDSEIAKHYLRDSYKLTLTDGITDAKKVTKHDSGHFYLNIKDNSLYRFVKGTKEEWVRENITLDPYTTTTPQKKLLSIAKVKLGKNFKAGQSINLSSSDVFHHITNQEHIEEGQTAKLKMNTAQELLEEIILEELGIAKVLENLIFGLMMVGVGGMSVASIIGLPIGLGAFISGLFSFILSLISLAMILPFASSCVGAAVVNNTWFKPEISQLKEKLKVLDAEEEKLTALTATVGFGVSELEPESELGPQTTAPSPSNQ